MGRWEAEIDPELRARTVSKANTVEVGRGTASGADSSTIEDPFLGRTVLCPSQSGSTTNLSISSKFWLYQVYPGVGSKEFGDEQEVRVAM